MDNEKLKIFLTMKVKELEKKIKIKNLIIKELEYYIIV
jgi:hypothetical protein